MRTTIVTTEKKAIELAKKFLKSDHNVKRLAYSTVRKISCQCNCGETGAVDVTAEIKGRWFSQTVGFCENCGDK